MQISLCGPAYKHSSVDVNNQRCVNLFPVTAGPEGRGTSPLVRTSGLSLLLDLGDEPIRCLGVVEGLLYAVCGASVYKITVNYMTQTGVAVLIGTMTSTSGTVYMASNPDQIMWVDGTATGYIYQIDTSNFHAIVTSDFPGAESVVFIDSYFVVNEPDTGKFYVSSPNDGDSWDPLDVATAETSTDNIVGLGVTKGELWIIGEKSTEIWYNAANASGSPFSLRTGLQMQIGCGAKDSIVAVNDLLTWLDHRGFIVQSAVSPFVRSNNSGYDMQIISDEAITTEILSYSRRDDAIAMSYNDRGHIMYQITFPTAKKTWVYDYTTKGWHERSYFNSLESVDEHHLGQFYATVDSLHIMGGTRDGKLYLSSPDYRTDNEDVIRCVRTTPVQYDKDLFRLAGVDRIDLRIGINAHSETSPQVTMRYSHNGGHTWSDHLSRNIGETGEYAKPVTWNRLGVGREWVFEFVIVEDMEFTIIDAVATINELEG